MQDWKPKQPEKIPGSMWIVLITVIAISITYSVPKTIRNYRGSELQETVKNYLENRSHVDQTNTIYYQVNLYFLAPEPNGTLVLNPIPTEIDYSDGLNGLMTQLLAGLTLEHLTEGNISLIPDSTRLIGSSIVDKAAYIEFSKELQSPGYFGKEGTELACKQIARTAQSLSYVDECIILIDGTTFYYDNGMH